MTLTAGAVLRLEFHVVAGVVRLLVLLVVSLSIASNL